MYVCTVVPPADRRPIPGRCNRRAKPRVFKKRQPGLAKRALFLPVNGRATSSGIVRTFRRGGRNVAKCYSPPPAARVLEKKLGVLNNQYDRHPSRALGKQIDVQERRLDRLDRSRKQEPVGLATANRPATAKQFMRQLTRMLGWQLDCCRWESPGMPRGRPANRSCLVRPRYVPRRRALVSCAASPYSAAAIRLPRPD